jgi:hypothetical protein
MLSATWLVRASSAIHEYRNITSLTMGSSENCNSHYKPPHEYQESYAPEKWSERGVAKAQPHTAQSEAYSFAHPIHVR